MRLDPLMTASPVTGARRPVTPGLLRDAYLVAVQAFDLAPALDRPAPLAQNLKPAPWAQSFATAPEATAAAVQRALVEVARATSRLDPAELRPDLLPEGRAQRHLAALRDLWADLGTLPEDLQILRAVIAAAPGTALEPLHLLAPQHCPHADPVERALAEALLRHHGAAPGASPGTPLAPGALGHVQAHLTAEAAPVPPDETLQIFGLRDPVQEADFAASLIQRWLDRGLIARPAEAGLLVPADPAYGASLAEAFDRAGLPLSGAPPVAALRDPARELALALVAILTGPAPRTALATVATSPLAPWPAEIGRALARDYIERGYSRLARTLEGPAAALLSALRPVTSPAALCARLAEIDGLLVTPSLAPHIALLRGEALDPARLLRRLDAAASFPDPAPRSVEGVTVATSPLAPWPAEIGRALARDYIERGYSRLARTLEGPAAALLSALRPVTSPAALCARLAEIDSLLLVPSLAPHIALLRGEALDPARLLRRLDAAASFPDPAPRSVEGVTVVMEPDLPWRPVRRLIVLGLQGQGWPQPQAANPFFTETELATLAATGLVLPTRARTTARRLELFRRQLGAASEAAVLLAPARDLAGAALSPTTGFALISRLLGSDDPTRLVQEPEAGAPLPPAPPVPLLPESGELRLGRDLLGLRAVPGGETPPQSPSALETLILSPLAWTLDQIDARDRTWAPESLDVMTLGTLVHAVIEALFPVGPPPEGELPVEPALAEAIAAKAPWLTAPIWAAERASLLREVKRTVQSWARFLAANRAETLACEVPLAGDGFGLPLAGRADALLALPDGRRLVVDHKRGSSSRRRKRMELGWDLQVALYRAMLERPATGAPLHDIATAYHTTLDGAVLTDGAGVGLARAECPAEDPAHAALAHLKTAVAEVAAGRIRLNLAGDPKRFEEDRGMTAYALEDEFVSALLLPEPQEEEAEDD